MLQKLILNTVGADASVRLQKKICNIITFYTILMSKNVGVDAAVDPRGKATLYKDKK